MAVFVEQMPKKRARKSAAASHSTRSGGAKPSAQASPEPARPSRHRRSGHEDQAERPDGAASPPLPAQLARLAERARNYVEAARSANTRRAYASDWRHYFNWCRWQGPELFPFMIAGPTLGQEQCAVPQGDGAACRCRSSAVLQTSHRPSALQPLKAAQPEESSGLIRQ